MTKKDKLLKELHPLLFQGVAHRGLHNSNFTENGLNAFKNAIEHNFAIELDIHLSKDNELIVCHDSNLERVTGKYGIIEELTLSEIKNNYRLLDDSQIPTFKEVLTLVNEQVPMLVELKIHKNNCKSFVKKLKEDLKVIKNKKNIILISFNPRALIRFKNSGFFTSLLITISNKVSHSLIYKLRFLFDSLDLDTKILKERKVIRYRKKHIVFSWTTKTIDELNSDIKYADFITFQDIDPEIVKNLLNK